MKKGLIKSTFREIKESFGRYMAILLIVALGVGFFSGLKVAYSAMLYTADTYLKEQNFYDYHLLSTMGFDEDTAEYLEEKAEDAVAEGSKSVDVLMTEKDGTELVIKTMELPENVNKPELTAGRMPENAKECLVDEHGFGEDAIGSTLTIAEENTEENRDKFKETEYTIVGLVRSPLYTLYQRGTTSIGNGSIDAYIYLEPEAYNIDYDTDIYVVFDTDAELYSDEYSDFMDSKEEFWEDICQTAADMRYERIFADASGEIDDAEETLQEKKADGADELAEALEELNSGQSQLQDGENAIDQAKKTIEENAKTLEEKENEYKKGQKTYQKQKAEFDKGKSAYEKGLKEYNSQYKEYETSRREYEASKTAYEESERQYAEALALYENGKDTLSETERQAKEQELKVWRETLDTTSQTLTAAGAQLDTAKTTFAATKKTLDEKGKEIAKGEKQLAKAKKELEDAGEQIEEAKEQLASARSQISEKEQELEDAKAELLKGQTEYEDAKKEYDEKIRDAEEELADARQEVEEIEKPETYVLGRDSNAGYASFQNDAGIVEGIARVFPIFFFLVAALVCMTTMARMMEEQRTQVGVLKALGYSNGAVMGKYIIYSGSAAVIGAVVGFFAGTWAFSVVIWKAYQMMYDMGSLHYVFKPGYAVISIIVALLCSVGTTVVSCYQELQEMTASLMRPKAPKVGKRVLLERIPAVWSRLKFLDKVSMRNLFRYKKRLFMMIVGVSGCTALLVTGMGIRDSISKIADKQFDTISLYDLSVNISEGEVSVDGMEDALLVSEKSMDMQVDNRTKSVNVLVPESSEQFAEYMDIHDEDGEEVAFPKDNEVVISFKTAENYGIKIGDKIRLQNSDLKGGSVTVSGIYINYFNHYVIMTPDTYKTLFGGEADYNEMFANISEGADVHAVSADLMKQDGVTYVSASEDMKKQIADMMKSLDYVVVLVIACAAMLAFIVIYNLNNINITERIREIATIKVLGFYREETNSYVFRENIILTLLGSLVGVVLGHYLHAFVMSQIQIDAVAFDTHVSAVSYIISVCLTLLFNQLVNLFMSRKLENIDMAESLKSVE